MTVDVAAVIGAYLIGSVPTAYILGKWGYGIGLTRVGSGNVGTVNAWRELGWRAGLAVLVLDAAKGAAVMGVILGADLSEGTALASALTVTVAHNFSPSCASEAGRALLSYLDCRSWYCPHSP